MPNAEENAQCGGSLVSWIIIGDHGMGGRAAPASPMPTPMRAANKCQKFCASPESAVIRLQIPSAHATRLRRCCGRQTARSEYPALRKCGKGKTREHAHGRIGKTQIIYRLQQDRQYLTVSEVKRIDNDQNA